MCELSQQERSSTMQVVEPSNSRSLIVSSAYPDKAMSKVVKFVCYRSGS